ncbi:hypothetical protein PCH70_28810 [Pseudomonas cichorii JBC1]|nr:hypothetical protein PCH70_28810 [Pseudomonas cichorii JBC1]
MSQYVIRWYACLTVAGAFQANLQPNQMTGLCEKNLHVPRR